VMPGASCLIVCPPTKL